LAKDASSAAKPLVSQIQLTAFGALQSWQMQLNSGAEAQERVYDQYGRLVHYPLGSVVRDITYDAADRIASYTRLDATTGQVTAEAQAMNQSFSYDEMGGLTGIATHTTEATSNRLSDVVPLSVTPVRLPLASWPMVQLAVGVTDRAKESGAKLLLGAAFLKLCGVTTSRTSAIPTGTYSRPGRRRS